MKIVCIGAGMASLVAAEKLARGGAEVLVLERSEYENLSYDWHDDVNRNAFLRNDLPLPKEGTYFRKHNWSFVPPSERVVVSVEQDPDTLDWSTERRLLAQQYVERARDVVTFRFGCKVDSLYLDGGVVKGVIVSGEIIPADLVIDNSGARSPFRGQLPAESGVTAAPAKDELFCAYRAFHKPADAPYPKETNKAYLKHLGETGISWCIMDPPSGTVNVLVGRVGELSDDTFERAYAALKKSNPIIGDEVVRGGGKYYIPVRRPLTRMVWDGYVAIGDAAFMTIPMLGSGIECSINAACILANVVLGKGVCTKEALWQYEVEYYELCGANHIAIDLLKRWLLGVDPSAVDFLFEKGVLEGEDMVKGSTGQLITLTLASLVKKVIHGISRLDILLTVNGVLNKCNRAAKLGKAIPRSYDVASICAWEKKIGKLF